MGNAKCLSGHEFTAAGARASALQLDSNDVWSVITRHFVAPRSDCILTIFLLLTAEHPELKFSEYPLAVKLVTDVVMTWLSVAE